MNNNYSAWQKVSFSEYLNDHGKVVKFPGSNVVGDILFFCTIHSESGEINTAQVSSDHGEFYIVPFNSLHFINAIT